jgi:hypothetical protein
MERAQKVGKFLAFLRCHRKRVLNGERFRHRDKASRRATVRNGEDRASCIAAGIGSPVFDDAAAPINCADAWRCAGFCDCRAAGAPSC